MILLRFIAGPLAALALSACDLQTISTRESPPFPTGTTIAAAPTPTVRPADPTTTPSVEPKLGPFASRAEVEAELARLTQAQAAGTFAHEQLLAWYNTVYQTEVLRLSAPPTPTPLSPTAVPIPSPTPTATIAPTLISTPQPTLPLTQTPRATAAPTPSRTPSATASPALANARVVMLGLINQDRANAGLQPVLLGDNPAAQVHADEMLARGYVSHWGLDGQKPYMRYTLAGGVNYEAENVSGVPYPVDDTRFVQKPLATLLSEAETGFMNSPGHRLNILNKWHKKVSLGIAWNRSAVWVSQQFEGDYIAFSNPPSLDNSVLSFTGRLTGSFALSGVQIWYDPLPSPLTLGQLGATSCYDAGIPAAFVREEAGPGRFYTESSATYLWSRCTDPYSIPPSTSPPAPGSTQSPPTQTSFTARVPWLDATTFMGTAVPGGVNIAVSVNMASVLATKGAGSYTVRIWGNNGAESRTLANYVINVGG